ncbi:MAG: hypothetical protein ACOYB1_10635 [Limnohabitans sp.]
MIISQSITQLAVRSLTYLSLLVILPTFIAITSAAQYANFVLISTLVMLAPLFDGGQAMAMTRWLAANPTHGQDGNQHVTGIALALQGSLYWSLIISGSFMAIWLLYAGLDAAHGLSLMLVLACMVMTALTTVANTCNRLMLTGTFTILKAAALLAGPTLTATVLAVLRYVQVTDIFLIATAFGLGASLSILLYAKVVGNQIAGIRDLLLQITTRNKFVEDRKYRYGLFMSQGISILVVAKNPLLVRFICGDSALVAFSLFSAANALIIAPAAAIQAPLLVSYSRQFGGMVGIAPGFFKTIALHTLLAIVMGACVAAVICVLNIYFHQHINKDTRLLTLANLAIILGSASIYIGSIVMGVFFAAIGSAKLINTTAVIVLLMDTLLIFFLGNKFEGITPFVSIALANILAFFLGSIPLFILRRKQG